MHGLLPHILPRIQCDPFLICRESHCLRLVLQDHWLPCTTVASSCPSSFFSSCSWPSSRTTSCITSYDSIACRCSRHTLVMLQRSIFITRPAFQLAASRVWCKHDACDFSNSGCVAAWQGVMLDIVSMLFTLLRAYVPAEVRWSFILDIYDMFSWNICMCTILYCVFFSLACALSYVICNRQSLAVDEGPLQHFEKTSTAIIRSSMIGIIQCSHPLTISSPPNAREWPLVWLKASWIPSSQVLRSIQASTFFMDRTSLLLCQHWLLTASGVSGQSENLCPAMQGQVCRCAIHLGVSVLASGCFALRKDGKEF